MKKQLVLKAFGAGLNASASRISGAGRKNARIISAQDTLLRLPRGLQNTNSIFSTKRQRDRDMALARRLQCAPKTCLRIQHHPCITVSSPILQRTSPDQPRHGFHTSLPRPNNSLFNLGGLSTSRECQYLAKERRIPRTEFAPHLELIRSSEVEPHGGPGSRRASTISTRTAAVFVPGMSEADARITNLEETCKDLKEEFKRANEDVRSRRDLLKILATGLATLCILLVLFDNGNRWLQTLVAEAVKVRAESAARHTVQQIENKETNSASMLSAPVPVSLKENAAITKPPTTMSRLFWAQLN